MMDIQKAIETLSAATNSSTAKNWRYTPYVNAVLAHIAELQQRAEAAEAQLAELANQEPVLYALRFKNSRGEPENLINENCLFRDREKAAAYGLGGNYVTQESGKIEWVKNPALDPEVIPLFTRAAPPASFVVSNEAFSSRLNALYDCLQDCNDGERGLLLALTKMGVEVQGE